MPQSCHQRYGMRCTRYKAAPARAPPRRHHGAAGHKVRVRPEALRRRGAEALLSARGARREAPLGASARLGQSWVGWQPQGLASLGRKVSLNQNSQQIFCWCLFYSVHLIMVDSTQLDYALILSLKSEICWFYSITKFRADILSLITLWFCFKPANKLDFPKLHHIQKA